MHKLNLLSPRTLCLAAVLTGTVAMSGCAVGLSVPVPFGSINIGAGPGGIGVGVGIGGRHGGFSVGGVIPVYQEPYYHERHEHRHHGDRYED